MALLSPGKGISNWLRNRGVKKSENQGKILKMFHQEHDFTLDMTVTIANRPSRRQEKQSKQFEIFSKWFLKNKKRILDVLKQEWKKANPHIWKTGSGRNISVKDMKDTHIRASIRKLTINSGIKGPRYQAWASSWIKVFEKELDNRKTKKG